ncbi:phage tail tip fiber protein [Pseudaeromonas paramecii]|uniref:Tip attachment protein J central straight fiber domain-containing protein n=1 Tax=Pseudaeromonas paramecii TaxID=2138166 RepID=A0ABP8PWH1_9GAMM
MAGSKAGYRAGRDVAAQAENIELLTGQRGDRLDKAITYRDLADIGLITLRKAANKTYYGEAAPGVLPDDTIDRPSAPTGVIANGAFHTILVEWDKPAYNGHAYAEVWRAEEDNRAMAVMVGVTAANLYSDAIGGGAAVFYWVRFVNRNNIVGPFNAMAGTYAETSRDVQDILNELEGKIAASHLVAELLAPIQAVPQLQINLTALNTALDQTAADLAALDAREAQVNDLLQSAQDNLGNNYLSVVTIQEQLRQKIDQYQGDFASFRDAVFAVDPTTGEITMDAVNAVRSELGAEITAVSNHLDAIEAIVNTCVTRAELAGDLERITSVEQTIDGINATLALTATKSELTAVSDTVSQVSQTLDATNVTLSQKAGQSQVDEQGSRLTAAEQQISANTTATEANAQLISQVKAQLEQADSTIASSITSLEQAIATQDAATAQRLTALETTTSSQSAQLTELQQVISGDGQSLANKFENIQASLVLAGESSLESTLASAEADRQARAVSGQIRQEQSVLVTEQAAQAKTILELTATFQSYSAELTAQISTVQTTLSNADQALAQRVDQVESAYQAADSTTNASLATLQQTVADGDSALSQQISGMDVAYKAADATNAAAIASEQTARVSADQALSTSISQLDSAYRAADATLTSRVATEETTRASADSSLSTRIDQVTAGYQSADSNLQGQITSEASSRATADQALSSQISTVQAQANSTSATVQTQSQAIANLQNGAEAMWTAKASASGITAGIGLVAKSDGTSQVAISASQVFVFNPNSPNTLSPLFAIDNDQVIMAQAIIEKATIQILNAQTITADFVKAGVSLSAPVINGGQITIGSNFLVTSAGVMTAWSATLRYVTSLYGTFRYATIDQATITNCTITEDCDVKGTIYAERIVGGVYSQRNYTSDSNADINGGEGSASAWYTAKTINVTRGMAVARTLDIEGGFGHYEVTTGYVTGNIPVLFSASMKIGVRLVRDGSVVVEQGTYEQALSAQVSPGGNAVFSGSFGKEGKFTVPGDGKTHYYQLQYRRELYGLVVSSGPNATLMMGSDSDDEVAVAMYIESGDLA